MNKTILPAVILGATAIAFAQQPQPLQTPPGPAPAPPAPNTDVFYQLGPDSFPRDGVPKGDVRGPYTLPSQA